jgi:hypothetical protein
MVQMSSGRHRPHYQHRGWRWFGTNADRPALQQRRRRFMQTTSATATSRRRDQCTEGVLLRHVLLHQVHAAAQPQRWAAAPDQYLRTQTPGVFTSTSQPPANDRLVCRAFVGARWHGQLRRRRPDDASTEQSFLPAPAPATGMVKRLQRAHRASTKLRGR